MRAGGQQPALKNPASAAHYLYASRSEMLLNRNECMGSNPISGRNFSGSRFA
jgi:hypothetical protein